MRWFEFVIGGQKWTVHLVSPRNPNLRQGTDRYFGRCLFDKRRIYIDKTLAEDVRDETAIHEIIHVLVRVSGGYEVLESALTPGDAGRVDEALVSVGAPHLHGVLRQLGFRLPHAMSV